MMKIDKRRKYLIDQDLQFYILKTFVWAILIVSIGFGVILVKMNFYMSDSLVQAFQGISMPQTSPDNLNQIQKELANNDMRFIIQVSLAILLISLLISFMAIRFSHKVAGPIYRIRLTIREVKKGNVAARAFIRENDKLQDFADEFNEMLDSLEEKIKD